MKKQWPLAVLTILCACAALILCAGARAQNAADTASLFSSAPYRVGEHLNYTVSFSNFQTAALLELFVASRTTQAGRDSVELRAHAETTGVVNAALYALNNDYVAFVDPVTGLPFRTQQFIREGARTQDVARDYNQPLGASAFPPKQSAGFPGTYDFLSAIYRLRALPLAQGASYTFTVQSEGTAYDAELRVMGHELLKTNIGSFNSIATQVRVRRNPEADNYRIRIFFSEDERHIPLLMTAQHPSGEIRAEIASADFITDAPPGTALQTPSPTASPRPDRLLPVQPGTLPPGAVVAPTPRRTPTPPAVADAVPADLPFSVGEQLNFTFFLGNAAQAVGTASFQVRTRARYFNRDGLLLASQMATAGPGQTLFPVNDQINSYVDATTLLPFRTELRLQEGRRRTNWVVSADQDRGTALFDDGTRLEIPVGTHDLVSVLYALRSFDLTPPKRNAVSLLINKRPRALFITSLRRESIQLNNQTLPAILLSLVTDEAQGDRLQLRLWVSADRRRLPLRITAVTPLGPVRADLSIIPISSQ